ncbi:hypothetical protein DCAR_0832269 [Daucus carota subsp. sativus]|uniref:phosphoribosylformylglycinamidine cyclo-ligase n=1 Tax=Daucus carota subsp. sativus TaxID=79200 RepID=A0AAF0XR78_DAUCS|nr:PREDICTED: phosphoribosylformylglycinamidine cyclo-ligase, chloroplastic-like isoform X3 [Daucus carota subsp. sativus]WOH12761.1 hypothetical protein DCAR_0832269 [Daucus carota subsp. sativus]
MNTNFGASIDLARCNSTSLSLCSPNLEISVAKLHVPVLRYFSNRLSAYSFAPKESLCRRSRKASTRILYSISNTYVDESNKNEVGLTYKSAGVDIDAGSELVKRIAKMTPGIGGFGGLYPFGDSYLVAGTDGVGTKLKLAFETGIHDTIGIDLVIKGIVEGCQQSECVLLGGETAEMPDFYADGEYDLSGFAVGSVKKDSVINGKNIVDGDVLIGLPSSGIHSNGFSLVRRVLTRSGLSLKDNLPGESATLAEALMAPTVIYVKQVLDIISKGGVKGIAHITGGGFTDNIPRVFPEGLGAVIFKDSWVVPPIFKWIQKAGSVEDAEMRRTFNMGIGMVLVVSKEAALRLLEDAQATNVAYRIGEVVKGDGVSYQ